MADVVKNSDLVADDLFVKTTEQGKALLIVLDEIEKKFKEMLTTSSKVSSKDKEFEKATKDRKDAVDGLMQVEKKRAKALEQIALLETKQGKALEETKLQLQRKRKAVREEIKAEQGLITTYEKQTKRLKQLKKDYKDLILQEGRQTKETRRLRKEALALDATLKKVNKDVSSSTGLFKKASNAARNMVLALGGFAILRDAFNTVKDFNQSIANLSAITGATGQDLDFLKNKAIELGSSTTLSAGQVAEAFKLIASAKPELLDNAQALAQVTEQAIILAEAAGIEVTTAADSLTLSLNQFGAGADEASKFIDVLAAGSKKGAGDVDFLNAALLKSGGTADAAGLSFKDTVAVLETLAPVLGSGEEAGTKFRNILGSLQQEGIGFASGQFNINDAIAETNKMLDGIDDPAKKAAARIKLFGKQNDAAAIQLLSNADALEDFQVSLDENGIALEQQAINNDTLQGAMKALSSAWEGVILRFSEGTGVFGALKDVLFFVAENLETIVKVVASLGAAFAVYKVINKTTKAFKALSVAMNVNPFVLVASAVALIATALIEMTKELSTAEKIQQNFIDIQKEAAKATAAEKASLDSLLEVAKNKNLSDEERIKAIEKLNEISPEYLGNLTLENIATEEGAKAIDAYIASLDRKALAQAAASKKEELFTKRIEAETKGILDLLSATEEAALSAQVAFIGAEAAREKAIKQAEENRAAELAGIDAEIEALNNLTKTKIEAGEIEVEGAAGGESTIDKIEQKKSKNRKKELTGLDLLRDKLAKKNKLLEDELVIRGKTEEFRKLLAEARVQEDEIAFLEEKLRLEKEGLEVAERRQKVDEETRESATERAGKELEEFRKRVSEQEQRRLAEEEKRRKEEEKRIADALKRRQELISNALDAVSEAQQEATDERLAEFDKEIAANDARIEALRTSDEQSAQENLAFARKRQAELEQQKQDEIEKAANIEAALALIGTFQSNIAAGQTPGEALANTAVSAIALKQLISSIDFFYKGTEDTGTVANPLDSNGGRLAVLHDNERVMTAEQNKKVSGLSNWELANAGAMYKAGTKEVDSAIKVRQFQSNDAVIEQFGTRIENAIKDIDVKNVTFLYDTFEKGMIEEIDSRNKLLRIHHGNPRPKKFIN
jgi:TP901 family phage tail tape measure protein